MRLQRLRLCNFKSFRGEHALPIGDASGLYYLCGKNLMDPLGSNGAGKSNLFEAWEWAWYGRTHRNLRGSGIEPWGLESAKAWVRVEWENEFGVPHTVYRQRNPNLLTLQIGEEGARVVEQSELESVLGLSLQEFVHVYLLGQSVPLFFDLTSSQKMEMLQEVLDLASWVARAKQADQKAKDLNSQWTILDKKLLELSTRQEETEKQIEELRLQSERFRAIQQTRLADVKAKIAESQKELKEVLAKQRALGKRVGVAKQTVAALKQSVAEYGQIREKSKSTVQDLDYEKRTLTQRISELCGKMERMRELGKGDCPTCFQRIGKAHLADCLSGWEEEAETIRQECSECGDKLTKAKETYQNIVDELEKEMSRYESAQKEENSLEDELQDLQGQESRHLMRIEAYRDYQHEVEDETDVAHQEIELKQDRIQTLLAESERESKQLQELEQRYEATAYWAKGFREIRLMLLDQSLVLLEVEVNNALQTLGLGKWRVSFDIEKETSTGGVSKGFHVMIQPPGVKKPAPWESYSGGESQRLRLAGRMAVASLITSRRGLMPGIEIYDEPSAGLSPEGIDDLLTFLEERAQRLGIPIFIVDHRALDTSTFAGTVRVVKDERGSHLEVDE